MSNRQQRYWYPKGHYTILIICPLALEAVATKKFFDENHQRHSMLEGDVNVYTFGKIRKHYVVMATPPTIGTTSAATVATDAWRTFPNLRFTLLVGIAAGISRPQREINLGDVVIGKFVRQYDLKKEVASARGTLKLIDHLNNPPDTLNQIATLAEEDAPEFVEDALEKKLPYNLSKPPKIHYGVIASGNSVVKDAAFRDQIQRETDAICIEMEAAGLASHHKCLTIRGIADFADEQKTDTWQRYAAMAAAAVATFILNECPNTGRQYTGFTRPRKTGIHNEFVGAAT
ncbi:hypothetical protein ABW20_dc0102786 [Dactylellina cionopaga]|nr:hypothetical protein ABW20_dc0102786 [Dactylellina cionopaga]